MSQAGGVKGSGVVGALRSKHRCRETGAVPGELSRLLLVNLNRLLTKLLFREF